MDELSGNKDKQITDLLQQLLILKDEYEKRLENLEADHRNEILEYKKKLHEIELNAQMSREDLEKQFRKSWAWRIGRFQTNTVKYVIKAIIYPFLFVVEQFKDNENKNHVSQSRSNTKACNAEYNNSDFDEEIKNYNPDPNKFNICCIFDTFTKNCFEPELNLLSPGPRNWKKVLCTIRLDALFVESAWHGNGDSWRFLVGKHNEKNLNIIKALTSECHKKDIPTIFWNKEDPVHFDKFIETAQMFDYIFTTDADCIPKYLEHTKHNHIYALPFAAQPNIHNPVLSQPRIGNVCFAGSYHVHQYIERQHDMEILLKPAMAYGLDIFDRMFGTRDKNAIQYQFPDIYQPYIRGKLEYNEMIDAYKKYKVFLNVNSVKYSPTMFARRVFELLACGTPVISSYSKGIINLLGEDIVLISESEKDTQKHLDHLLGDDHFWWRKSLAGIRKVMEFNTYKDRANMILTNTGLGSIQPQPVSFLVIAVISSMEDAVYLSAIIHKQAYSEYSILLVPGIDIHFTGEQLEKIRILFHFAGAAILSDYSEKEIAVRLADLEYTHAVFLNANNYYGKNYFRDYALAVKYSEAKIIGRKSGFSFIQSGEITEYNKGFEFMFVNGVPSDTLLIEKKLMSGMDVTSFLGTKEFIANGSSIFSLDPYNFLRNGRKAFEETQNHILENFDI